MGVGTKRTIKTPHGNHNTLTLIQEETVKMGNRCLSLIGSPVGEPEENLQSSKWSDGQGWDSLCPTLNHSKGTKANALQNSFTLITLITLLKTPHPTPNSLKASASRNSQVLSKHYLHVTSMRSVV